MKSNSKNKNYTVLPILTIVLGLIIMTYSIIVEDEPTFVALFLVFMGAGWYALNRFKITQRKR